MSASQGQPAAEQRTLSSAQIEAFYHDGFVADQVRDFLRLTQGRRVDVVVDMGGGCGYFARALQRRVPSLHARVVDTDPVSVDTCLNAGVEAQVGDALRPPLRGDESGVCFNLILHHLVADSDSETRRLQTHALQACAGRAGFVFVNEYIYESFIANLSGWLIFQITHGRWVSKVVALFAKVIPPLRANTLGVGVRFRAHSEWEHEVFAPAGFRVVDRTIGQPEPVSPLWRLLLIRQIRRDSFLLVALDADPGAGIR